MSIPGFAPLGIHSHLEQLFGLSNWRGLPDCAELNRLWGPGAPIVDGRRLRFVVQDAHLPFPELSYAQRIAHAGMIATRAHNWHDVFNALTWLSFPRTKLAITQRLADDADDSNDCSRTEQSNALTLFDECAVVLAAVDSCYEDRHESHDWRELFVGHRADWGSRVCPVVFGHGFYDQARDPYLGLTAKAWYERVPASWLLLPAAQLQTRMDERLEFTVAQTLNSPRQLLPLPVLGVPGWWPANKNPAFYDNTAYFRPKPAG